MIQLKSPLHILLNRCLRYDMSGWLSLCLLLLFPLHSNHFPSYFSLFILHLLCHLISSSHILLLSLRVSFTLFPLSPPSVSSCQFILFYFPSFIFFLQSLIYPLFFLFSLSLLIFSSVFLFLFPRSSIKFPPFLSPFSSSPSLFPPPLLSQLRFVFFL